MKIGKLDFFKNNNLIKNWIANNLCEIDLSNSYLLQVHISILAEIGDKTALFKIAHRLIGKYCNVLYLKYGLKY